MRRGPARLASRHTRDRGSKLARALGVLDFWTVSAEQVALIPRCVECSAVWLLPPQTADPALGVCPRPRRPHRRLDHPDAFGAEDLVEVARELPVTVTDQEAGGTDMTNALAGMHALMRTRFWIAIEKRRFKALLESRLAFWLRCGLGSDIRACVCNGPRSRSGLSLVRRSRTQSGAVARRGRCRSSAKTRQRPALSTRHSAGDAHRTSSTPSE